MSFYYYAGPYTADLTPPATLPGTVLNWLEISREFISGNSVLVHVAVDIPATVDFGALRIYANGYLGVALDIRVAQAESTTFTFSMKATGELVRLKAVIVNSAGAESDITTSLFVDLSLLSNSSTSPVRVSNLVAIDGATGTTLTFDAGSEGFILGYRLYRSLRAQVFANAVLVASVPKSPDGSQVFMFDPTKGASLYNWYVTAVSKSAPSLNLNSRTGESTPSQAVFPAVAF